MHRHRAVQGLPSGSGEASVRSLFSSCGRVKKVRLRLDAQGVPKDSATVEFSAAEEARAACERCARGDVAAGCRVKPYSEYKQKVAQYAERFAGVAVGDSEDAIGNGSNGDSSGRDRAAKRVRGEGGGGSAAPRACTQCEAMRAKATALEMQLAEQQISRQEEAGSERGLLLAALKDKDRQLSALRAKLEALEQDSQKERQRMKRYVHVAPVLVLKYLVPDGAYISRSREHQEAISAAKGRERALRERVQVLERAKES